jgi:OOP family OmpA-OmpF porin
VSGPFLRDPPPATNTPLLPDGFDELATLRRLLLLPEQEQLGELKARLEDPMLHAQDVSRVLAEAVALRYRQDDTLRKELAPVVVDALRQAIAEDPAIVVDVVFPVIGPAIRRAVAESFRELTSTINRALSHAFSVRGLRWRWEAWRTGRAFAEIVMLHSMVYRVDEVFLIHRSSGIVLNHVQAGGRPDRDEDATAAMLTAIRDFAQDALGAGEHESLDALQVGDVLIWVESGPEAILAAVIWGVPPGDLRTTLQDALETIHRDCAAELRGFSGDTASFEGTAATLEGCLVSAAVEG